MARLTKAHKAERVLKLLLGLHDPRVLGALSCRGFDGEDVEEGWRLLRALSPAPDGAPPARPPGDEDPRRELDDWENTWFPVASATLRRRFVAVHRSVFLNLSQRTGNQVVLSVGVFVERVTALRGGDAQCQKAAALLVRRGLNDAVLEQARRWLDALRQPKLESAAPEPRAVRDAIRVAEAELWSWYLEWSELARGVISDRRLLRDLGLRRVRGSQGGVRGDEDGDEDSDDDLEAGAIPPLELGPVQPVHARSGTRARVRTGPERRGSRRARSRSVR